jgi:hypothetical protein
LDFIVRILFSGLIAFVPSEDGTELNVLLLNTEHAAHTSDGSALPTHHPFLIARAGNCTGDCDSDTVVATTMFRDQTSTTAQASLAEAVNNGAGWALNGSDLTVNKGSTSAPNLPALVLLDNVRGTVNGAPQIIPTTSAQREDITWVADGQQICTSGCTLNSAVLGTQPPAGLIAARLRLRSGKVFTYNIARIGSDVTPVHFKRLDGTGSASSYSQAIATWVGADIEVDGDDIEIVESSFDGTPARSMKLSPDTTGKIEIAVLNNPSHVPPSTTNNNAPQVGKHFEAYYDLYQTPPARETRLVPYPGAAPNSQSYSQVGWHQIHPTTAVWSDLLNKLRLDIGRTMYDRLLCPPFWP